MNLLILGSLALFQLSHAARFCTAGNELCLVTTPRPDQGLMEFMLVCRSGGWCSVGLGESMADAEVFLAYRRGNEAIVTHRSSSARVLPQILPQRGITPSGARSSSSAGTTTYQWTRLIQGPNGLDNLQNVEVPMIWAYTTTGTINGEGDINQHTSRGQFRINLFSGQSVNGTDRTSLVLAHGVLMFLAWLIFAPSGIFVARFLKPRLGVWWFRIHAGFLGIASIMVVASFSIVVSIATVDHFSDPHRVIGLIVFILTVVQSIGGIVIDKLFDPTRLKIPLRDKFHWFNGRFLYLLGTANVLFGWYEFRSFEWIYGSAAVVALGFIAMILGEVFIGGTHHEEPADSSSNIKEISLPMAREPDAYYCGGYDETQI